jgi:hypothetical protein
LISSPNESLDRVILGNLLKLALHNHGYETPKQALETNSAASRGVLHPPLCGIVRLTNFNSLCNLKVIFDF